jgi:hypothetical protein
MLQKFFATAIAVAGISSYSFAQDSTEIKSPKLAISGYVDAYYRYNFANAKNIRDGFGNPDPKTNNYTSFTNSQNSFELGMASLKLEHSIGKVSAVVDLGFGKRAEEFAYNDANTMFAIKQAYVSYAPCSSLKLTAGSWGTHVGYEVLDPYLNRNYSMSYMFSYGPFSHTGLKAEVTKGKSGFMLGIANPTDFRSASFEQKMVIAQYSLAASDKLKFYLNYQGGKAAPSTKINQFDAVITATITDQFSLGYNGTIQSGKSKDLAGKYGDSKKWWGSALYVNVDPKPWFGLTLRGEYFDDKDAFSAGGFGANIFATTLSAAFKAGPLTFIPEIRYESASEEIYFKNKGAGSKSTATALLAAIYKF